VAAVWEGEVAKKKGAEYEGGCYAQRVRRRMEEEGDGWSSQPAVPH